MAMIVLVAAFAVTELVYRRAFGPLGLFASSAGQTAKGMDGHEDMQAREAESPELAEANRFQGEGVEAFDNAQDISPEPDPLAILQSRINNCAIRYGLTPREVEVGFLTAQGFSCSYIADKLVVSESTVRFHQKNLYRKFDVHSRNEFIEFVGTES